MIILHGVDKSFIEDVNKFMSYRWQGDFSWRLNGENRYDLRIETGVPVIIKYYNLDKCMRLSLGGWISEEIPDYVYSSMEVI